MDWSAQEVHGLVVGTGRLSAALFVLALLGAALRKRVVQLWLTFLAAHTVHFAMVLWFAVINNGRNLFPGGTSLAEAGGWSFVFASGVFFYALALTALAAAHADKTASRGLRWAGWITTTLIGFMFLATYAPLVPVSSIFALPVLAIGGALGFYWMRMLGCSKVKSP